MGQTALNNAGGSNLVNCLDSLFYNSCTSNAIPLTCGVTYSGPSSSAPSTVGTYGCNSWTETGPERIHSIVPSVSGSITATISNYTGDLDVYILGSCDPSNCLGIVSSSSASYAGAVAGTTYYIVVDADDGSGSSYDLIVNCSVITGTIDHGNDNHVLVYPNPTTGVVNISGVGQNIRQVMVTDEVGKVLVAKDLMNDGQVNLEAYAQGVYFFKVMDDQQHATFFKVIKR